MIIPNRATIQFTVFGTLLGQSTMTTFHYAIDRDFTTPTLLDFYTKCLDTWASGGPGPYNEFVSCCPTNWTSDRVGVQVIFPTRLYQQMRITNQPGEDTAAANTANVAAVITRRSQGGKRSDVGSIHVPAPTGANLISGQWETVYFGKLTTLASAMNSSITVSAGPFVLIPVLVQRKPVPVQRDIINTFPHKTARVMRRRTVGLGI